jgi:hypothetical protein
MDKIKKLELGIKTMKKEIAILKVKSRFDKLFILDFRLNVHRQVKNKKEYCSYSIELTKSFVNVLGRFKMTISQEEYDNFGSPLIRHKIIERYKRKFIERYEQKN